MPPVVREAERLLLLESESSLSHVYLPPLGCPSFREAATVLLLGQECEAIKNGTAFGIQSLSGTGALRIGAEFAHRVLRIKTALISCPAWANHAPVLQDSGFTDVREYRYWDPVHKTLDFDGMMQDLGKADPGTMILLQVCGHNPTGVDPTPDQWSQVADVCRIRKLFPFFDCAYQGLATGDLEDDAFPVRLFADRGIEFFCAQSFSKIFGLYSERVGNLVVSCRDRESVPRIMGQFVLLVTPAYLNPPAHGCRIVTRILNDPELRTRWQQELRLMAERLTRVRRQLHHKLTIDSSSNSWDHVVQQVGMFCFTGLSFHQVALLMKERHIYMPSSGRISVCGLNDQNMDHVARAFREAVNVFPLTKSRVLKTNGVTNGTVSEMPSNGA